MINIGAEMVEALMASFGMFFLVFVFFADGTLLGKFFPTTLVFPAGLALLGSTPQQYAYITLAAILASTAGQLLLFSYLYGNTGDTDDITIPETIENTPVMTVWNQYGTRVQSFIRRNGLSAVFVLNLIPLIRGTGTVPAAADQRNWKVFTAASLCGNTIYFCMFALLTLGIISIF